MSDEPELSPELSSEDAAVAEQLTSARAVPAAGFRGALGRHLALRDPGYGPRPGRLRLQVACYLSAGAAVIALGALTAVGAL